MREPPFTIPNREVKPHCADGTAPSGWESRTLPDQYTSLEYITQGFFYGVKGRINNYKGEILPQAGGSQGNRYATMISTMDIATLP